MREAQSGQGVERGGRVALRLSCDGVVVVVHGADERDAAGAGDRDPGEDSKITFDGRGPGVGDRRCPEDPKVLRGGQYALGVEFCAARVLVAIRMAALGRLDLWFAYCCSQRLRGPHTENGGTRTGLRPSCRHSRYSNPVIGDPDANSCCGVGRRATG